MDSAYLSLSGVFVNIKYLLSCKYYRGTDWMETRNGIVSCFIGGVIYYPGICVPLKKMEIFGKP